MFVSVNVINQSARADSKAKTACSVKHPPNNSAMEIKLLNDIVVIFAVAVVVLLLFHRLRLPAIIGFLFTGALTGPHGFGLVGAVHEVEILAEVGIVLLLFTIGIEFSVDELLRIKRQVLFGGALQVGLTIAATYLLVAQLGLAIGPAVFAGFLVSLSSTAIVMRLYQETGTINTSHGRLSLAVLIFQDIAIVPLMLFAPILAGAGGDPFPQLVELALKALGVVILIVVASRWIVPKAFFFIARASSRELFLISTSVLCFAVAWLTAELGLSLALGAFMAGLIISESEYSHQALENILPFRDVFTSFFFVSVGMLLDVRIVVEQAGVVFGAALVVIFLKACIVGFVALALGYPLHTALVTGLGLAQVGEFSFVLSRVGVDTGLLNQQHYGLFLAISVLTMVCTPFLMRAGHWAGQRIAAWPLPAALKLGLFADRLGLENREQDRPNDINDHVIIAGFGINGRNVARAARCASIEYVITETNPETVRRERAQKEPIFYGDASSEDVLRYAGAERARALVVTIPDLATVRRVIARARSINPALHIVARTRFVGEVEALHELGADEVIPEEFETSVEIIARVLRRYLVAREEIEQFAAEVRSDGYGLFRVDGQGAAPALRRQLGDVEMATLHVDVGAELDGCTLAQSDLRRRNGAAVLAVRRAERLWPNPDGDFTLHGNDDIVVLCSLEHLSDVVARCRAPDAKNA